MNSEGESKNTNSSVHMNGNSSPLQKHPNSRRSSVRTLLRVRSYKEIPTDLTKGCVIHKCAEWADSDNSEKLSNFSEVHTTVASSTPPPSSTRRGSDGANKNNALHMSPVHLPLPLDCAWRGSPEESARPGMRWNVEKALALSAAAIREAAAQQGKAAAEFTAMLDEMTRPRWSGKEDTATGVAPASAWIVRNANDKVPGHVQKTHKKDLPFRIKDECVLGSLQTAGDISDGLFSWISTWAVHMPTNATGIGLTVAMFFLIGFAAAAGAIAAKKTLDTVAGLASAVF